MTISAKLLTKIKTSLRVTHTALDSDIEDTMAACVADLKVCGVQVPDDLDDDTLDPLLLNAVKLYCKASYTDDPNKAARFQAGYDALKACLMMAEGYQEADADD